MIVAGLQFDLVWEDPGENLLRAADWTERAVRAGASLVVLPEMFATGFTMRSSFAVKQVTETRRLLSDLANRHEVHVLGGYAEPGDPQPLNACSLFGPSGEEVLRYHKIHPFTLAGEPDHYGAGDEIATAEVNGLRVTPLICYDLRFPEPFRAAAADTDLFVVIANWPAKRAEAWRLLLRARAVENQAFVLGVNRVGEGGGELHAGNSALVDPTGRVRAEASLDETIVMGPVRPAEVANARKQFSFLADRRPEVYARLEEGRETP